MGLAVTVGGGLSLWQASGSDCPPGSEHRVALAVLGKGVSACINGRSLWSVRDAVRDLQPATSPAGLLVWGRMAILEVRIRTFGPGE